MSHWKWLLVTCVLCMPATAAPEPKDNPIFPPDAKLELVFQRTAKLHSGLTEGPATAPDGTLYFTDMPFGPADQTMIQHFDPKTGKTTVFTDKAGKSNGLTFDAEGYLLACDGADGGGRCVNRWNVKTGEHTVVADRFEGNRFNAPNDLLVDRKGRIYFTDPRYIGDEPREMQYRSVYRIESDKAAPTGTRVRVITCEVEMPNGIVLSPDERTMYLGDHNSGGVKKSPSDPPPKKGAMKLYAFPLDEDGLVSGERRTLVDFGKENGCDGITVDVKGNIYVSCRSMARPGVMVIDPQGKELAFVSTGEPNKTAEFDDLKGFPSNVEFGTAGDVSQGAMLYVTIDKSLYRIAVKQVGVPPVWAK